MNEEAPQFCPHCEVSMDLHNGPGTCGSAQSKASLLETFPWAGGGLR